MNLLNSATFKRMEGALQAAELRQRVITNNVANNETPYFKRSEVLFEKLLEQTMGSDSQKKLVGRRTNEKHFVIGHAASSKISAKVVTDSTTSMNNNENNVDIEREMSLLAKNQLSYNAYVQQINHQVSMMRTAIGGNV